MNYDSIITDEMYDWIDNLDADCKYIDAVRNLYQELMMMVNDVDSPMFNPDMFAHLTADQFVDWVVNVNNQ
uniref:Uncharacterized protein n=1 Tax=viral metagenome TaxID=1070528 RepID=A0A6C0C8H9_9ZZZZ